MTLLNQKSIQSLVVLLILGMISSTAFAVTEASETKNQINPVDIQKALVEAGYYKGSIDGVIGSKTKEAIRKFQEANNLKVDGVCGPKTWEKLKAYLEEAADIDATTTEEEVTATTPTLDEEETNYDYGYSEYDSTGSESGDELKQKLVS